MPLIVEDGTGLANADSLASVAFADTYHADRGNEVWAGFTLEKKEQLLRKATDYIKYRFGPNFIGAKVKVTQAQPFPRVINYVNVGVPVEIQEAVAELALVANTSQLMVNVNTVQKKSVKVGPITVEYDNSSFQAPRFIAATSRLATYLSAPVAGMSTAKLIRT